MRSRARPKQITNAGARAQLKIMLCSCSEERLAAMTARGLAGMFNVPEREIEYELQIARQRRGAE